MHHLIPSAVLQRSIIRAGTGVARSWNFLSSPSCRKAGAAVRGEGGELDPRGQNELAAELETRPRLLSIPSAERPPSLPFPAEILSPAEPRAPHSCWWLQLSTDWTDTVRISREASQPAALELFFRGEAGDCSQNWAHTQAVPQPTSVAQSTWISFLLNKGIKQTNSGSSLI